MGIGSIQRVLECVLQKERHTQEGLNSLLSLLTERNIGEELSQEIINLVHNLISLNSTEMVHIVEKQLLEYVDKQNREKILKGQKLNRLTTLEDENRMLIKKHEERKIALDNLSAELSKMKRKMKRIERD